MARLLKRDHETAISFLREQLERHGIVSFPEVNEAVGLKVLTPDAVDEQTNPTGRFVAGLVERKSPGPPEFERMTLPIRVKGSMVGSRPPNYAHFIVRHEARPFIDEARLAEAGGSPRKNFFINALSEIMGQDWRAGRVFLAPEFGSKGTRKLVKMGLIEKIPLPQGQRPKTKHVNLFRIKEPYLLDLGIAALFRSIELRERFHTRKP
jgi:hypothetical protein